HRRRRGPVAVSVAGRRGDGLAVRAARRAAAHAHADGAGAARAHVAVARTAAARGGRRPRGARLAATAWSPRDRDARARAPGDVARLALPGARRRAAHAVGARAARALLG